MPPKKDETAETTYMRLEQPPVDEAWKGPPSVRAQDVGVGAAVAVIATFALGAGGFDIVELPAEVAAAIGTLVTFTLKALRVD